MFFRGESKNGFVISDLMDSSPTKITEDLKKAHLPRQQHVLVFLVMRKKKRKKKQTDPWGEDKKEKQHKLGMNIRNVDISV